MSLRELVESKRSAKVLLIDLPAFPELAGSVYVRKLAASEVVAMRDVVGGEGDQQSTVQGMCKFLTRVLCDEAGERIFRDDEWTMLDEAFGIAALNALGEAAQRHNGMIREEVQKNSETGQT